ncbi:GLPGLI family protein [Flavobacterium sp. ASW18X]|uniref:GLPGLI family protein n=1 Tax=Flavobacterium sp. ASW18X TaxID=2572595 RepID=UPI0010ADFE00|nr:GLPGLI family protein [Flavobacterium sp. ASW18X]TKD61014.1 GLPGLI family protein [Flavobacterium sp. ASW18X]
MVKKLYPLLVLLACALNLYAQQDSINIYQIQYERLLTFEDDPTPIKTIYDYTKFIELDKSICNINSKNKNGNLLEEDDADDSILYFTPSGSKLSMVYKDYKENELYTKGEVAYKYFVIKDRLDIFNWKIEEATKDILGFICQKATMDFRGRKYEAWFSSKLPVGGPWKYDGLPGMIMELKSLDNFIAFKAIGVKSDVKLLTSLENPFDTSKILNWAEYKALYKKKAIELLSYRPNENIGGIVSSRGGIETYIEDDDLEYNQALKNYYKN